MRFIIFLLVFTLPIDWFKVTGDIFRELGAKPANLIIILIVILYASNRALGNKASVAYDKDNLLPTTALILGTLSYFISILFGWAPDSYVRSASFQFVSQFILFVIFVVSIPILAEALRSSKYQRKLESYIVVCAKIYIAVYYIEAFGIIDDQKWPLSLFRTDHSDIVRATGLSSEPSYLGVYAAMAIPLIYVISTRKWEKIVLISLLIIAAVNANGKTFYLVTLVNMVMYFVYWVNMRRKFIYAIPLCIGVSFIVYQVFALGTFNFEDNLSSVMRIGSSHLGLNVIASGYGYTGIGFGQFHFFYTPEFAPNYLLRSQEAANQFSPYWESRASTFNYFLRLAVEAGIVSLILLLLYLHRAFKKLSSASTTWNNIGFVLLSSSVGFLLTQDTYMYPPLILGLAISQRYSKEG